MIPNDRLYKWELLEALIKERERPPVGRWRCLAMKVMENERVRNIRANEVNRKRVAKVSPDQVREIRKLCAEGLTYQKLAERFPVTFQAIEDIVKRESWADIA